MNEDKKSDKTQIFGNKITCLDILWVKEELIKKIRNIKLNNSKHTHKQEIWYGASKAII